MIFPPVSFGECIAHARSKKKKKRVRERKCDVGPTSGCISKRGCHFSIVMITPITLDVVLCTLCK